MKISVVIPCYEMHGYGAQLLEYGLTSIHRQTYTETEVVIGDQSKDNAIRELCGRWAGRLNIKYLSTIECRGNPSANLNKTVEAATGEVIKILFQDDFISDDEALARIAAAFACSADRHWLISGLEHSADGIISYRPFVPVVQPRLKYGINTFGPPSVLAVRRARYLEFNDRLAWTMDVDVYSRMLLELGDPLIEPRISIVSREWSRQNTHELPPNRKISEELLSLKPRALDELPLPAAAIYNTQAAIASTIVDVLNAYKVDTAPASQCDEMLNNLAELDPINPISLCSQLQRWDNALDPRWQRAACLLTNYHMSIAAKNGIIQKIIGSASVGVDDRLTGLRLYLAEARLNPDFPTRWLPSISNDQKILEISQRIAAEIKRYAVLAIGTHSIISKNRGYDVYLNNLLIRALNIVKICGLPLEPRFFLGRVPFYCSLPQPDRPPQSAVVIAAAANSEELLRQSLLAKRDVAPGGFVIQVDLAGLPRVVTAKMPGSHRSFLKIEQIFH